MPTETSVESHQKLQDSGDADNCNEIVYQFIKNNPGCSLKDIKEGTCLLQENVCGRKKYLEDKGLIKKAGEKINPETNRRVETWKVTEGEVVPKEETELKCLTEREMGKVNAYIRKANDFQKNKIKGWCEGRWD
jgi:predicted transcriptional regulator